MKKAFMKPVSLLGRIAIAATVILLVSCGFHLRGNYDFPFSTLYINFPAGSHTANVLKRQIQGMNATRIANSPQEAEVILSAISEKNRREILTYNVQGRVREYSLHYDLEYTIKTAQGKVLLPPTKVTLRRTMTYDDSEALSKENEANLLYKDMQSDMAQRLLRRLAGLNMNGVDNTTDPDDNVSGATRS